MINNVPTIIAVVPSMISDCTVPAYGAPPTDNGFRWQNMNSFGTYSYRDAVAAFLNNDSD